MPEMAEMLLRNLIEKNREQIRGYQSALTEIRAMEKENRQLYWLIRNGQRVFGSLWREASVGDIEEAMAAEHGPEQYPSTENP